MHDLDGQVSRGRSRRAPLVTALLAVSLGSALACPDRPGSSDTAPATTIDTIGDTVRVRTARGAVPVLSLMPEVRIPGIERSSGTELGRVSAIVPGPGSGIYIWDDLLTELRLYDSTGALVRRLGGKGQGPGEYSGANGIAPVGSGDVALWDPQTARFTIFTPDGSVRASWRWQSSLIFGPHALHVDTTGRIYVPVLLPPPKGSTNFDDSRFALIRVRPDGHIVDTLALPHEEQTPMLRAQRGGVSTGAPLPFAEQTFGEITPWGTIAVARAGRYAIDVPRVGGVLRIERDIDPIAVGDDERRDLAARITRDMRKVDPTWRWSGPEIPRTKPYIRELIFAEDARLWVGRSMPAERRASSDTTAGAPDDWIEPTTYDVFEPDGRLLGEVTLPPATTLHLLVHDRVWAVQRDSLDLPTIVRFRLRDR